ncbi:MAG TPA: glutathione S-transferase family protein [Myxococcota bacterium]|nr:glutathione S-transferase family protein [Myxococcota bacterium]
MKPIIHGFPQSSYVWTVRAAFAFKGVDYELRPLPPQALNSEDYLQFHPFAKVPALEHGDVRLYESLAICQYVDRAFGGRPLQPTNPHLLATMFQWISAITSYLYMPAVRGYLFGYIFPGTEDGAPDRERIDAALPKLERFIAILEENLDQEHLVSDQLTMADLFLAPLLFVIARGPEGEELIRSSPNVVAYFGRMKANAAFISAAPPPPGGRA